jgi:hypothetical protein
VLVTVNDGTEGSSSYGFAVTGRSRVISPPGGAAGSSTLVRRMGEWADDRTLFR